MASTSGSILSRCSARSLQTSIQSTRCGCRYNSTDSIVGADVVIPPESPRYVYIPQPPQRAPVVLRQRKGTLPVPRTPKKVKPRNIKYHVENTAPAAVLAPKDGATIPPQHKDYLEWKAKESELRRENFITGYPKLRARETALRPRDYAREKAIREKQLAPEPLYEEASRPSILSLMLDKKTWKVPKMSTEEIEARRIEHAKLEEHKELERRMSVHTLYVNAKDFIVTSEQLEKKLEDVFESDFYKFNKGKDYGIWDEEGWPEDTAYLAAQTQTSNRRVMSDTTGYTETARKRIIKVTEEMTGGKLAPDSQTGRAR